MADTTDIQGEALQLAEQALQAARQASQQAEQAVQTATQAARAVGVETTRATIDASRTAASQEIGAEREFEVGKDEAWAAEILESGRIANANRKRTYDEMQGLSLDAARLGLRLAERIGVDSLDHANRLKIIAERQLSNAATHDANLNAQVLKHSDLATDRTWNIDEVANAAADIAVARIKAVLEQFSASADAK